MGCFCKAKSAISIQPWCQKPKLHNKHKKKNNYSINKLRSFTYTELEAATNGFSPRNLLGKGSHGAVYFATLDGGAVTAAVKVSTLSDSSTAENEIEILSKIRSRRIVNLIGYAIDSKQNGFLLVVEYMHNGSLYDLIHTNPNPPTWSNRVGLALQVAKAVWTLHGSNPPVIHRDIKSSNVLIDERERAKVSDFGLALRGHVEEVRSTSTPPAGTLGYLDPCYVLPGDVCPKNDVFSFGILLLEIISGRNAIDINYSPPSIVEWALPLIESGEFHSICDRRIGWPRDQTVVRELALLAARCVRSTAEKRPSMEEVVDCLVRINKLAKKIYVWNYLRQRVKRVVKSKALDEMDGGDGEEQGRIARRESRRSFSGRSSKVYDVPSAERSFDWISEEETRGSHQMVRSKSMGAWRELNVGPDGFRRVKSRGHVTVKMSTVRLSKCRSMSVLHGGKIKIHRGNILNVMS